jgi:hypothetical protein
LGFPTLVAFRHIYVGILKEKEGSELKHARLQADVYLFFVAHAHRDLVYICALSLCCTFFFCHDSSVVTIQFPFLFSGHTRQGLKCRICKLNVHVDCQEKVGRCQPKSRLLRRQKSTSEIETRIHEPIPDEESEYIVKQHR